MLRSAGRRNVARLLDVSLGVFAERGFHATRVDDICERAEVSHGTFYRYFASKDDLFRVLVDEVVGEMRELAGALPRVGPGAGGRRALRAWLEEFYNLYARYLPVIRAWNEANAADPELARLGARVLREFIDRLLVRVAEQFDVPPPAARTAALAMVAMVERSTTFALGDLVRTDREQLLDTLAEILHVGLFGGRRSRIIPQA